MMKLCTVISYLKKIQKIHESRDTSHESYWHQQFFTGNQQILLYQEYMYRLHFDTKFLILLTFLELSKIVLTKKVTILMISAKMATPDLLKIMAFWNKGYDVIIYAHEVTKKFKLRDSNYIVDVAMWPKFRDISMREVIIISIL